MSGPSNWHVPVGLPAALAECGLPVGDVLAVAGLPRRLLDDGSARLGVADYYALWQAVRKVSGDPAIGIALVRVLRAEQTEPLFLAVLGAPSLIDAVQMMSTYKRILRPEEVVLTHDHDGRELTLRYVWPGGAAGEPPPALVDAELAFPVEMARRATGDPGLAPRRIDLAAAEVEGADGRAAYFGCPVRLGALANAVVFDAADGVRPFRTHNPALLRVLLPHLAATVPGAALPPLGRVRSVIAERLRGQRPGVDAVARELAMSSRALQRLLQENGATFRGLLDDVRREHARHYLATTTFTDREIAFLLGFQEPTSFYRAFQAWTGTSPGDFRRNSRLA